MTTTSLSSVPVTLIGLGPMGQAMARVLLAAGHPVTVWNRTASRADGVVATGATRAATPYEAVSASELVILSLTDYQAMYDILGPAEATLPGRTLVNLSSDSPQRTQEAEQWAKQRGAHLLAGGVMVPAPMVGTEAAYVYYSGPRGIFDTHEPVLRHIGRPHYVGSDPGLAQLFYQAELTVFLTTLSGLLQAAALVGSAGVPAADFVPQALRTVAATPDMVGDVAAELDSGQHPGELATTATMGATADHILAASKAAGIDLALPTAVQSHYARARAAGHDKDGWTSLFNVIKAPSA